MIDFIPHNISADLNAQFSRSGIYSQNQDVKQSALIQENIRGAIHGSTQSLNYLWGCVKSGRFIESDYKLIKNIAKGDAESATLSNGQEVKWEL